MAKGTRKTTVEEYGRRSHLIEASRVDTGTRIMPADNPDSAGLEDDDTIIDTTTPLDELFR